MHAPLNFVFTCTFVVNSFIFSECYLNKAVDWEMVAGSQDLVNMMAV